jgi:uncharacterized protein (TIGR02186 family)
MVNKTALLTLIKLACVARLCSNINNNMKLKALIITAIAMFSTQAFARPIITDLSERKIDINANFTGKDILLYGTRVEAGQVVVVIRGPGGDFMVRKKERVAGMWINTGSAKFYNVPQFYRIASSRELTKLEAEKLLQELEIGFQKDKFKHKSKLEEADIDAYKKALVEKLEKDELVDFEVLNLPFLEGTLFRIRIGFPEKVVPGTYTAEIYSFNEGQLQGMQSIPIKIEKVGIEAAVYSLAHETPILYGIFAIFIAATMGYVAGSVFKKV